MFNNNAEEGADFCEAYKSQILNNDDSYEKESSLGTILKILTILLLLSIIIGISIYGYNYFMNSSKNSTDNSEMIVPPVSIQTLDDELKVELVSEEEEPKREVIKVEEKKEVKKEVESKSLEELDIDKIANDVKLAIAKNEEEESKEVLPPVSKQVEEESKTLEIPTEDSQSAYLEELAKLSKEIDKERE